MLLPQFNPQLSYSPPPMRMSPSGGQMPPIAGGYGGVASPNRCSPLPPMPASPMQRTSPQIVCVNLYLLKNNS